MAGAADAVAVAAPSGLSPAAAATAARDCSVCGQQTTNPCRCNECGRVATAVSRTTKELGAELNGKFKIAMSNDSVARATFYQKAAGCTKAELVKLIEETVNEMMIETTEASLVGTGEYLDEEDLREKYKSKPPQRLEAILANAKRFTCPVSKVELFEDMKYRSEESHSKKHITEHRLSATTEDRIKKKKTEGEGTNGKTKKVKVEAGAEVGPTPLTEKEKESLTKWDAVLDTNVAALEEITSKMEENAEGWSKFLPAHVRTSVTAAKLQLEGVKAEHAMILESGQTTSFDQKSRAYKDMILEYKEVSRVAKLQISEAKKAASKAA